MTLMRHYDGEPMVKVELDTDVTLDIRVDGSFRGCEDVSVTATGFIEGVNFCLFCGRQGTAIRSERVSNSGMTLYAVRCYRCGAEGPMTYGYGDSQFAKDTAAAFWNGRAEPND